MKSLIILSLVFPLAIQAAEDPSKSATAKPKAETFLEPAKAGQDYIDQGEYKNDWGGAQIIALGDRNFRMVTHRGGLPGAGWDKEFKQETPGKREGDKIVFTGPDSYRAELANGKISITTATGAPYTMEKVERKSQTLGANPPPGANVLFDVNCADDWTYGHMNDRH